MSATDLTTAVEYREISEAPGYRFGSDGTVWMQWGNSGSWKQIGDKTLKKRYRQVSIKINGISRLFLIHRLILLVFKGPCPPGMQCRHLDGNRRNNRIENLVWGTCKENHADRYRHGTVLYGEDNTNSKLTEDKIVEIRRLAAEGMGQRNIAIRFGIGKTTVSHIVRRENWIHVQ